jgi:RNA polymerase sigma-70 factor (ECF subfamily)
VAATHSAPTTPFAGDSDQDLIAVISSRSSIGEAALEEAYRRHGDAVFGLALRVLHDRSLAEDVAQDVFLSLWRKPDRFDPNRGKLRTFLLTMAHSRAVDVVRSEESRRAREERDHLKVVRSTPSIEDEVIDMHMAEHVRRALDTLSIDERRAIELAYFGGQSYRQVAATLEQPEGTVKSRIRSGMKQLGRVLEQHR